MPCLRGPIDGSGAAARVGLADGPTTRHWYARPSQHSERLGSAATGGYDRSRPIRSAGRIPSASENTVQGSRDDAEPETHRESAVGSVATRAVWAVVLMGVDRGSGDRFVLLLGGPDRVERRGGLVLASPRTSRGNRARVSATVRGGRGGGGAGPDGISRQSGRGECVGGLVLSGSRHRGEETCWERCLTLDPANAFAYSRLFSLAEQEANYQRIVDLVRRPKRADPHNVAYRGRLGSALMYLQRNEEAKSGPGTARERWSR